MGYRRDALVIESIYHNNNKERLQQKINNKDDGRYKTLFEQVNAAVLLTTLSGEIIDANVKSYEMFHYSFEELISIDLTDLLSPLINLDERIEEIISHGGSTFEATAVRKNHNQFPVEISTSLFTIENQPAILFLIRDITNRKKREQILLQQEKKYRRLFESTTDGMIILDERGEIIDINQQTLSMIGLNQDETINQNILNLGIFSEKALAIFLDQFEWLLNKKQPSSREVQLKKVTGENIDIELSSFFLYRMDDEVDTFVVIFHDLSERQQSEKNLEKTQTVLHLLLEHTKKAIYYKDTCNQFQLVNTIAAELFETIPEEMIGKNEFDFFPKKIAQPLSDFDQEILNTGQTVTHQPQTITLPYGIEQEFIVTKIPHINKKGDIIGLLSILKPVATKNDFIH